KRRACYGGSGWLRPKRREAIQEDGDLEVAAIQLGRHASRAGRIERAEVLGRQERALLALGCRDHPFPKQRMPAKFRHWLCYNDGDRAGKRAVKMPRSRPAAEGLWQKGTRRDTRLSSAEARWELSSTARSPSN